VLSSNTVLEMRALCAGGFIRVEHFSGARGETGCVCEKRDAATRQRRIDQKRPPPSPRAALSSNVTLATSIAESKAT